MLTGTPSWRWRSPRCLTESSCCTNSSSNGAKSGWTAVRFPRTWERQEKTHPTRDITDTGLDENTWLTDAGYPHSIDTHVQERFTRRDHNDLELTLTVDDPKFYTKPFSLGTEYFRWVPDQLLDERLCIPSNVIEYLKAVGDPAGKQP